jgi:NAD(P)-dependent dehydrogenase (short-subunit alcohol dehydrogenase family)
MLPSYDFSDRTFLITGAASGIGRATALKFAASGARLLLADIHAAAGNAFAEEINANGGNALHVTTDVSRAADVEALMRAGLERFGRIDGGFLNAGIEEESSRLGDGDEALFDRMIGINLKGVWLTMRALLKEMQVARRGVIVSTASVAGVTGAPKHAIYSASKHAVVGLTRSAAAEYGRLGIRVNAVCPAVIRTPMLTRVIEAGIADEAAITRLHPIGRIGEVEEIAHAVQWLCSDAASFVTGHLLLVDGGYTAV